MVYLIYGPEPYRRDFEVTNITKDLTIKLVDSLTPECREALEGVSLFGKQAVLIKVKSLGADDTILKYLRRSFPRMNELIIVAETVNKKTKLYDFLSKNAKVVECTKLSKEKMINYCLSALKSLGCIITSSAIEAFVERSGYLVDNNITLYKINIYLKQLAYHSMAIEQPDVEALVPKHSSEDARMLLSFLLSGREKEMMILAMKLNEAGEQPIKMYGAMLRNLRIAYKAVLFNDKDERELGRMLGLNSYQMRMVSDVRRLPKQAIYELINLIQNATNEIKNGLMPASASFMCTIGKMISLVK